MIYMHSGTFLHLFYFLSISRMATIVTSFLSPPTPPMSSLFPLNLMTSYLLIIIHICPHVHICTHKYYLLIHLVWLICICLGMTTWDCITYWGVHPWRRLTLLV